MQVIGFNLTRIAAERELIIKPANPNVTIQFTNVEKEKIDLLKENEAIRIFFRFSIVYGDVAEPETEDKSKSQKTEKQGEISFEGAIVLSASKEESKDLQKAWKKKQLPEHLRFPLYNTILKKCSIKAASLEEEIGLPSHVPIPQLQPKPETDN